MRRHSQDTGTKIANVDQLPSPDVMAVQTQTYAISFLTRNASSVDVNRRPIAAIVDRYSTVTGKKKARFS